MLFETALVMGMSGGTRGIIEEKEQQRNKKINNAKVRNNRE